MDKNHTAIVHMFNMKMINWLLVHIAHWAVLYAAFVLQIDGAMHLLKFFVWVTALISPILLTDICIQNSVNNFRICPVRLWSNHIYSWTKLLLLVWFGHIITGLACGFLMIIFSIHLEAVKNLREKA